MTAQRPIRGATTDSVLEIRQLSKSFGDVEVLKAIDLTVQRGEFLTLLGPSGSGKTTLLRIIAGFEAASGGQLLLDGTDIGVLEPSERRLGMVFQNYALFPHMTVADNIAYGLKQRKYARARLRSRVDEMLQVVGLTQHAGKRPSQLSGGQQQRVALARALAYEPEILLMDEPLGALDRSLRLQMEQEIKQVHRETGTTVIYVTHDQEEALVLSDRVAIMNHGVFAGLDTPMNLFTRPENSFVATFFSDSNILDGTVSGGVLELLGQRVPVDTTLAGPVKVAVRPAQVSIVGDGASTEAVRLRGTVREVDLLGELEQVEVDCEGGHALTVRRPVSSSPPVDLGSAVDVEIAPSRMTLMAD
ncbi:ABC transporter ATP-binding protein [Nocardioides caldifontis]|uniref:ABC transporter ATP-binding protein n=1 Tax=Nocardioides caldifontis TaxID=2588938 RepID=UPI001396BD00|nr:ABC transporter ATP-binding protein [Nocardioides caldifontis]